MQSNSLELVYEMTGKESFVDNETYAMEKKCSHSDDDKMSECSFDTDFCDTVVDLGDTYNLGDYDSFGSVRLLDNVNTVSRKDISPCSVKDIEKNSILEMNQSYTKDNCSDKCESDDDVLCFDPLDDQHITAERPRYNEETHRLNSEVIDEYNFNYKPKPKHLKSLKSHRASQKKTFTSLVSQPYNPKTKRQSYLKSHIETLNGEDKKLPCRYCNFKTTWRYDLKKHMEDVHGKEKRFNCYLCSFRTRYKNSLATHIDLIHTCGKFVVLTCKLCKFSTRYKPILESHVRTSHGIANWMFSLTCNLCGKCFKKMNDFDIHGQNCSRKSQKTFTTNEDKPRSKVPKSQKKLVTREGKLNCMVCRYRTNDATTLRSHVSLEHADTLQMVTCNFCQYRTYRKASLDCHLTNEHGEYIATTENPQRISAPNNLGNYDAENRVNFAEHQRDNFDVEKSLDIFDVEKARYNYDIRNYRDNVDVLNNRNNLNVENNQDNFNVENNRGNFNVGNNPRKYDIGSNGDIFHVDNNRDNFDAGNNRNNFDAQNSRNHFDDTGNNRHNFNVGNNRGNIDVRNNANKFNMRNSRDNFHVENNRGHFDAQNNRGHVGVVNNRNNLDVRNSRDHFHDVGNNPHNFDAGDNRDNFGGGNNREIFYTGMEKQQCGDRNFKCRFCEFECPMKQLLEKHLLRRHPDECVAGNKEILQMISVEENRNNFDVGNTRINFYVENNRANFNPRNNQSNIDLGTKKPQSENRSYKCEFCLFESTIEQHLGVHLLRRHPDQFAVEYKKRLHMISPKNNQENLDVVKLKEQCESNEIFTCQLCGFQTRLRYYLDIHNKRKHDHLEFREKLQVWILPVSMWNAAAS